MITISSGRLRNTFVAAALLVAAPFTAAIVTAPAAHAEIGSSCPITYHYNGVGIYTNTLWVDYNPCGRPSRIHSECDTFPGSEYWRDGNIVITGASKANCDITDSPVSADLQYQVNGTWYTAYIPGDGSFTFYT